MTNARPRLQVTAAARPAATISAIERSGTNQVTLRFNTASNWTCVVQGADDVPAGSWSSLLTIPAQALDDEAEFVDTVTNRQRFYRLLLSR